MQKFKTIVIWIAILETIAYIFLIGNSSDTYNIIYNIVSLVVSWIILGIISNFLDTLDDKITELEKRLPDNSESNDGQQN